MPIHSLMHHDHKLWRPDFGPDALFFFDFDGVLATQCEEKVFRLEELPGEREALEEMAAGVGVDHTLYPSTGYLRHMIYQEIIADMPITANQSLMQFAQELTTPFFIITARSGHNAVKRMHQCLDEHGLRPQEVFCLGRASKGHLLEELRKDWPTRPFYFFEDSKRNIDSAMALDDPYLHVKEVLWPTCTKEAERLRYEYLGVG